MLDTNRSCFDLTMGAPVSARGGCRKKCRASCVQYQVPIRLTSRHLGSSGFSSESGVSTGMALSHLRMLLFVRPADGMTISSVPELENDTALRKAWIRESQEVTSV
jgi:hypothetical protein